MQSFEIYLAQLAQSQEFLSVYNDLKSFFEKNGVEISIDKDRGLLTVNGSPDKVIKVSDAVRLLLDGVSLRRVERYFLNDEYYVEIDLRDTLKPREIERTLARIIGSNGSFKRKIEEITNADLVVRDSKVVIVGSYSAIEPARLAVEEIILGKPQSVVIRNLERRVVRDAWRK